jgi:hypothetical protein
MPNRRIYQNENNMLLNFPRCLSILLLQKDNNALDIDAIYNPNLEKHNLIQQAALLHIKLNGKFPWPLIKPKQRECILFGCTVAEINFRAVLSMS